MRANLKKDGHGRVSLLLMGVFSAAALTACGGGGGNEGPTTTEAPSTNVTPPPVNAQASATVDAASLAWRVSTPVKFTLKDAKGVAISSSLGCTSDEPVKLSVAADCASITGLRLGNQTITVTGGGVSAKVAIKVIPQAHPLATVGGGQNLSVVTTSAGEVLAWGYNDGGTLGQGKSATQLSRSNLPLHVLAPSGDKPLSGIVAASAGERLVLALTEDGQVLSWGGANTTDPSLGRPNSTVSPYLPDYVVDSTGTGRLSGIVAVAAGQTNAIALADDGRVYTWGYHSGQGLTVATYPGLVAAPEGGKLNDVVAIGAGWNWHGALRSDGRLAVWGFSSFVPRMLQQPDNTKTDTPAYISATGSSQPLTGLKSFSAGYNFGVALSNTGEVWAFGLNENGQLGQGTKTQVLGASRVKMDATGNLLNSQAMVVAGGNHALSLDKSGKVWSWGFPWDGQLGDGPNAPRQGTSNADSDLFAQPVVSETGLGQLENIATLAAGKTHSIALRRDGTVLAWGANGLDALGQGTVTGDLRVPTAVKNTTGNGTLSLGAMDRWANLLRSAF